MPADATIYVAGHRGLVGSAILRHLQGQGYRNLVTRTHAELDLTRQAAVEAFFERERPAYVFLAAARVGGILANSTQPAEFLYDNLAIQTNVLQAAWKSKVQRLLFLGSSCIYPRNAPQPLKEEYLLTGELEPSNEPYAVAKIAGLKMCEAYNRQYGTQFIAVMPTNLYGPNDNFDLETSHVIPALIRKFHEAVSKGADEVVVWGTGAPRREFLYVDDLADACGFLMNLPSGTIDRDFRQPNQPVFINVGTGKDMTIGELAETIAAISGFRGRIRFDPSKPDGTPRKILDLSRLRALDWRPKVPLTEGIRKVRDWYAGESHRFTGKETDRVS
ncbi:MAG: GDP-L-fucose synthase [Deltaproteobacteria bacterium]|nr:GDP-L-fucose synthase [Deltaproteobacteria bacterium]